MFPGCRHRHVAMNRLHQLYGGVPSLHEKYDLYASSEETGKATWRKYGFNEPEPPGNEPNYIPQNRVNSAAAIHNGCLYVHSGRTVDHRHLTKEEQAEEIKDTPQQMDVLNLTSLTWTCHKHDQEQQPTPEMKWPNRTLVAWDSKLYLFGGESETSSTNRATQKRSLYDANGMATMFKYTIATRGWQKITPVGRQNITNVPTPRIGHTATILLNDCCRQHKAGPKMLVFGGRTCHETENELIDELWSFDLLSETWHCVQTQGTAPSPRAGHSAVMIESESAQRLFVYGGIRYLNVQHNLSPGTATRRPRLGSAAIAQFRNSSEVGSSAELFVLNTKTLVWAPIFYTGLSPGPVFGHVAIVHPFTHSPGKFCVFGGKFSGSHLHPSNNMFCFDASLGRWNVVKTKEEQHHEPSGSYGSVAGLFRSSIVIYGGSTGRGCTLNAPACVNICTFPKPPCLSPIDDIITRLENTGNAFIPSVISYRVEYTKLLQESEDALAATNQSVADRLKRTETPFRLPPMQYHKSKEFEAKSSTEGASMQAVDSNNISSSLTSAPVHFDNRRGTWNNRPSNPNNGKRATCNGGTSAVAPLTLSGQQHRRNTFSNRPTLLLGGPSASSVAALLRRRDDGGETKTTNVVGTEGGRKALKKLVRTGGVTLTRRKVLTRVLRKTTVKL